MIDCIVAGIVPVPCSKTPPNTLWTHARPARHWLFSFPPADVQPTALARLLLPGSGDIETKIMLRWLKTFFFGDGSERRTGTAVSRDARPSAPVAAGGAPAPTQTQPKRGADGGALREPKGTDDLAPGPKPAPPAIAPTADRIELAWDELLPRCCESIRQVIDGRLVAKTLAIPSDELGRALKQGRVLFQWAQLVEWTSSMPAGVARLLPDQRRIELPLAMVAPMFLNHAKPKRPRRELVVPDEIPSIFSQALASAKTEYQAQSAGCGDSGLPLPVESSSTSPGHESASDRVESGGVVVKQTATPELGPQSLQEQPRSSLRDSDALPAAMPSSPPSVCAPPPASPEESHPDEGALPSASQDCQAPLEVGEPVGEREPCRCEPDELVQQVRALPGVEGVVLSSADGLLVSADLPGEFWGDAVAAFLPRLFNQAFANALPFGIRQTDLVSYEFANIRVAVVRTDAHFLAALSRLPQPLPLERLRQLGRDTRFE